MPWLRARSACQRWLICFADLGNPNTWLHFTPSVEFLLIMSSHDDSEKNLQLHRS
jgi:hypothetical protein